MRRLNPQTLAMIAGALVILLLAFLLLRGGNADQDKLTGAEGGPSAANDPEKRCASQATYDLIKRELFRRASQVRGSDQAAFDQLATHASVRMERPVLESENEDRRQVACSGALSLDLPPGLAVAGGRRTLTADVDYSLQRAADNSGEVLTLTKADAIITPLATLARTTQPRAEPAPGGLAEDVEPSPPPSTVTEVPEPVTPPQVEPAPEPAPVASARPSFNCGSARSRGEIAVCRDPGLASLDRQMASQFNRAMANAGPGERAMLTRTRTRFLNFRDRCGSDACIADAYRGRMAEIRDIMSGEWTPPR